MFMTYREALKKTALFVPVSLLDRDLWRALGEHAGELLVVLVAIVGRLGAIALYPLAVPILAALVVAADQRDARERERRLRELRERFTRHQYEPRELRAGDTSTSP
ncbi:hypothetical protein [Burkholderia phage FLC10]|uniref:hypothetical protein n=1 Tax=Burkholderia phage FLC10 TaxID=2906468 RepID=UPI0023296508|nr:hypothetical protein PQA62_gp39 [Burkholderia phage FLC10]BDD79952.1 hypothetical protein [Burkholderia phage FLC10]